MLPKSDNTVDIFLCTAAGAKMATSMGVAVVHHARPMTSKMMDDG